MESALDINPWNFSDPKQYVVGASLEEVILIRVCSILLKPVGSSITLPGDDLAMAIKRLWDQRIFGGFNLYRFCPRRPSLHSAVIRDLLLQEQKGDAEEIREILNLIASVLQESDKNEIRYKISKYYTDKGFYKPSVTMAGYHYGQ